MPTTSHRRAPRTSPRSAASSCRPAKRQNGPWEKSAYLAVEPEEFKRLYQAAKAPQDGRQSPPAAQLVTAHYTARLDNDALVGNQARWTFQSSAGPTLVDLGRCSLAISDVRWTPAAPPVPAADQASPQEVQSPPSADRDDDAAAIDSPASPDDDRGVVRASAVLGSRTTGELVCLIDGPGELTFNWKLGGQRDSSGSRRFELILPKTVASTLGIDLPLGVSPTAAPGTVTAESAAGEGLRRWRIDLGPSDRTTLRIAPLAELAERERLTLVRQTLNYDISARGLELVAEHDLDVHYQPLRRIDFVIAPGLQLAAARYGETLLEWTVLPGGDGGGTRVTIDLPEPVLGEGRKLRLSARGEVLRGQHWQLPTVRPEGLFWQEGRATIRIGSPLVATQLDTHRCRQTARSALPSPLSGESMEVQFFDPQAAIELVVDRQPESIALSQGIRIELSPYAMAAAVVAELTAVEGEWLELSAQVRHSWNVSAIESVPREALADWSVDEGEDGIRRVKIRLTSALAPEKSLALRSEPKVCDPFRVHRSNPTISHR